MAGVGYSGYFMQGLASGLQSGVNMGMSIVKLKWQKDQQKKLDDLNTQFSETWNNIGQELITLTNDGQLSDDDLLKVYTMTIAAPYEMQDRLEGLRNSISQFNKKDFETQMEYLNSLHEYAQGLTVGDIDALYEMADSYFTNPHARTLMEVSKKKLKHITEAPEATPYEFYGKSPAKIQEQIAPSVVGQTRGLEGVEFLKPEAMPENEFAQKIKELDMWYKLGNPQAFNTRAKQLGIDTTFEQYGQKYEAPKAVGVGIEEEVGRTDIAYWEKTFNEITSKEEYDRQYSLLQKSDTSKAYKPKTYKEILISDIKAHAKDILDNLFTTDNKGNLVFIDEEAKKAYSKYQKIYEQKIKELKELYPEIDISQFPELKPIEEMTGKSWFQKLLERGKYSKP